MHVAHFIHRYPPAVGGSEAYFARLGEYLAAQGDTVTVWTSTAIDLDEMWHPRVERYDLPPSPLIRRYRPIAFPGRRYVLKAASLVPVRPWQCLTLPCNPVCPGMWRDAGHFAGSVDAVHATAFPYAFPIACGLRLARRRGVPFLLTPFLHLGDPADSTNRTRRQYTSGPLRWLLNQADRVFVQTPSERTAVVELGVAESRVVLQGLGVDPAECAGGDRIAARQSWGVGDERVVGHLGNLSEEKGACDLLRAIGQVPSIRVIIAGPEMPNFRRFWATYPHQARVTRLGVLTNAEKRYFFAGIDVFALPSRTDSFGLVLLEAWANGTPVVAYRAGGPADLVRDGIDGLLAGCGDVGGLRRAIDTLAENDDFRRRLGEAGRERVGRAFRWADKLAIVRTALADVAGS